MIRCDKRGFPELDLSQLLYSENCVVRCHNKHDARNFLSAMIEQYPIKTEFWSFPDRRIEEFGADHFDFFPYLNLSDDETMAWDDQDYAENNGYTIIEFNELPIFGVEDLGIFVPADELLDELLT